MLHLPHLASSFHKLRMKRKQLCCVCCKGHPAEWKLALKQPVDGPDDVNELHALARLFHEPKHHRSWTCLSTVQTPLGPRLNKTSRLQNLKSTHVVVVVRNLTIYPKAALTQVCSISIIMISCSNSPNVFCLYGPVSPVCFESFSEIVFYQRKIKSIYV